MRLVRKFCHRSAQQSEPVANQVVAHLNTLLTSTAQFSSFNPQFGLTCEVGEQPSNALLERIADDIKLQVSRFEQRFLLDEVMLVQQASQQWIRLTGKIENQRCQIDFLLNAKGIV